MDSIKHFFIGIWNDFVEFMHSIMLTLFDLLKEVFYFIFETLMDLIILALQGFDYLFEQLDILQYIEGVPTEAANLMGLIGVGEAMGMIVIALTIRFLLQLIPFIRLGS